MGFEPVARQVIRVFGRVKVGLEIVSPQEKTVAEQTSFGKQVLPCTAPSGDFEQCTVVPQVVHRLTQQIGQEKPGDSAHPAQTPRFVAPQSLVDIESRAAVFAFFAGMPQPQCPQPVIGMRQKPGLASNQWANTAV